MKKAKKNIILSLIILLITAAAVIISSAAPGECLSPSVKDLFKKYQSQKVDEIAVESAKAPAAAAAKNPNGIRIATYNLQGVSSFFKTADLAKVIKTINADFVMLTESVEGWMLYPNQPKVIANKGVYPFIVFKGNIRIWTYFEKMGNAILSRTKLYGQALKDLPKIRKDSELRGIAIAKTKVNGCEVVLISAHLSRVIHKDERIKQIQFIADLIKSDYANTPVILAGDLNTSPAETDVLKPITDIMDDGFMYLAGVNKLSAASGATIPADKPDVKFDYIFLSKGKFNIKSFQVNPSTVSDHRPFVVEAELK